jgi:hypothetical protein
MLFRAIVSLFAIVTVAVLVYSEIALSYAGLMSPRDMIFDAGFDAFATRSLGEAFGQAALTTTIYTLPECLVVLMLYHLYAWIGRAMGLAPNASSMTP